MKFIKTCNLYTVLLLLIISVSTVNAQTRPERGRVYTISSLGMGLATGDLADVMKPKVSTKLGLEISVGQRGFFLSPTVDFLVFNYYQQERESLNISLAKKGRGTITNFALSVGNRQKAGNFYFYEFLGAGSSLRKEARFLANNESLEIEQDFEKSNSLSFRGGVGAEYMIGQFVLFTEGSVLYNKSDLQARDVKVVPLYLGFKSNISGLFKGK